jgi:hypothetical protein
MGHDEMPGPVEFKKAMAEYMINTYCPEKGLTITDAYDEDPNVARLWRYELNLDASILNEDGEFVPDHPASAVETRPASHVAPVAPVHRSDQSPIGGDGLPIPASGVLPENSQDPALSKSAVTMRGHMAIDMARARFDQAAHDLKQALANNPDAAREVLAAAEQQKNAAVSQSRVSSSASDGAPPLPVVQHPTSKHDPRVDANAVDNRRSPEQMLEAVVKGNELLGLTMRDRVTGFVGVVTGHVEYITGCDQLLLVPSVDGDGKMRDSNWFDRQRCEAIEGYDRVVVDNSQFTGPDKEAPKR